MSRRVSSQNLPDSPESIRPLSIKTARQSATEAQLKSPSTSVISPMSSVSQRSMRSNAQAANQYVAGTPKSEVKATTPLKSAGTKSRKLSQGLASEVSQKQSTIKKNRSSDASNWVPSEALETGDTDVASYKKPSFFDMPLQMVKATTGNQWKKYCAICCCLLLVIIGIIAMIIYFGLWVGMPDVNVLGILSQKDGGQNRFALDLGSGGLRTPSVNISCTIETIVSNDNHMDLYFDVIDIYAYDAVMPNVELTHATVYDLYLPQRSHIPLNIPVTLQFMLDSTNNAISADLTKSCTKAPGKDKPDKQIQLNVRIEPRLQLTSVIKIKIPPIYNNPAFDCPFAIDSQIQFLGFNISLSNLDWSQAAKGVIAYLPQT